MDRGVLGHACRPPGSSAACIPREASELGLTLTLAAKPIPSASSAALAVAPPLVLVITRVLVPRVIVPATRSSAGCAPPSRPGDALATSRVEDILAVVPASLSSLCMGSAGASAATEASRPVPAATTSSSSSPSSSSAAEAASSSASAAAFSTCHHASERAKPALSFEICPSRGWQPSMRMYGHALCRVTKWMVEAGLLAGLMLQLGGRGTDGRRALPRGLGHHLAPVQHVGGRRCCVHRIGGVATPRFVHLALDGSVDGRSLAIWLAPWASGERAAAIRRLCWWRRPVAVLLAC